MAIGRISGPMLRANLERQGVDLSVETDLLYLDVNNNRIGINKAVPTVEFDLAGDAVFDDNLQISGTTISSLNTNGNISINLDGSGTLNISNLTSGRIAYVGASGSLIDDANLSFDGSTVTTVGANIGNISIAGNTIGSTNTNGNIVLDPDGSGTVNVSTLTQGRVVFVGASGALGDSSNLTFDGTNLYIAGETVLGSAVLGNIIISGNTISSVNTNDDIVLDPNGIGNVVIDYATPNRVFYSGANSELSTNNSLTYDGSTFAVDNISITANTISSTDTDGDITVAPDGSGQLVVSGTNALTIPNGSTLQRPTGTVGDIRVNTTTGNFEYYDGSSWQTVAPTINTSTIDTFSGDGSTTGFTLSGATTSSATIITLNGVVQSPGNAYNISGTGLTFTEAPKVGDDIEVRYISTAYTPGSQIADLDTTVTVDDSSANIVSRINGSNVTVTTSSSTTFSGSIFGIGSIASVSTSVPSSSSDTGTKGQIAYDASYVYICVDTDTWIRSSIQYTF